MGEIGNGRGKFEGFEEKGGELGGGLGGRGWAEGTGNGMGNDCWRICLTLFLVIGGICNLNFSTIKFITKFSQQFEIFPK
jgi:hypothetical protein